MSPSPERLLDACLQAGYAFDADGATCVLRPGETGGAAQRWLSARARSWGFLTAFNPASAALCEQENLARHENLLREVEALGWRCIGARGLDPAGEWPEETGLLILDRSLDELVAIAQRYGQNALLHGEPGQPARVVALNPDWRAAVEGRPDAAAMAPTLLRARGLGFTRDEEWIFRDLDFDLDRGGCLLIAGSNGSGKTTLMRLVAGLLSQHEGTLTWNGKSLNEIQIPNDEHLYIGHKLAVKDDLTALENLIFLCELHGVDPAGAEQALSGLGLAGYQDTLAVRLSAGQRKRVALGRLALDPRPLWLLDEPFANLDVHGVELVSGLIAEHTRRGGAVLLTSHGERSPWLPEMAVVTLGSAT